MNDEKSEPPLVLGLFIVLGMFTYWPIIIYIVSMKSKGIYIVPDVSRFNLYAGLVSVFLAKMFRLLFDKLEGNNHIFYRNVSACFIHFFSGVVVAAAFSVFMFVLPSLAHK
ncbi:hypothetical protein [Acinetobacter boissieri]|uniref:Uncharacterized protein n=1 Tax=Acinetobacter boissieri TaxID=1219383 RepID=A0A1G6GRW1_9GAMM|nr:hypothetical protein [Acinetobacter boissieri]SDB84772.1 hypothetical protein SAMN05421733_102107 [Acinetobacter boissieri]